ncbi:hypothetical protein EDEG_03769 [Edhazardia aedis USNM 41457]|uniref:CDP-diacylglycerol--glycerol-3-phosphate 3-phosphatidyltransferase n=1 Tax=Edhazardia aedis (strain USNM 41457) TaxID=1003232 RepID=J9DK22_EDHAE|nr:hypothetical protein EDEG_03769 [Edhazardia aedis USNM 41457]|eukprot:EJW01707.1 hypothetical protein EDEG_03769 [Edhazardia aedis USNM 41457]
MNEDRKKQVLNILNAFKGYQIFEIEKINFLKNPNEYFHFIKSNLLYSEDSCLMTLCFGDSGPCLELLKILCDRKKLNKKTIVILDKNRANRSKKFFEIVNDLDINDIFEFFDTDGSIFLPSKINELVSVLHSKIYIFDDLILFSGANLNETYFTNRVDRYIYCKDNFFGNYLRLKYFRKIDTFNKFLTEKKVEGFNNNDTKTFIIEYEEKDELDILKIIFEEEFENIYLSTAYMNFTKSHFDIFENKNMKIITSSQKTNTFNDNSMVEKFINDGYTNTLLETIQRLRKAQFYEYKKEGYSFHCKGVWCFTNNMAISIIGSSNFNFRSINRDVETNFLIITIDENAFIGLQNEINTIIKECNEIFLEDVEKRETSALSRITNNGAKRFL